MAENSDSDFSLGDFEDQNNHENGENGSEHESGIDGNRWEPHRIKNCLLI